MSRRVVGILPDYRMLVVRVGRWTINIRPLAWDGYHYSNEAGLACLVLGIVTLEIEV